MSKKPIKSRKSTPVVDNRPPMSAADHLMVIHLTNASMLLGNLQTITADHLAFTQKTILAIQLQESKNSALASSK